MPIIYRQRLGSAEHPSGETLTVETGGLYATVRRNRVGSWRVDILIDVGRIAEDGRRLAALPRVGFKLPKAVAEGEVVRRAEATLAAWALQMTDPRYARRTWYRALPPNCPDASSVAKALQMSAPQSVANAPPAATPFTR